MSFKIEILLPTQDRRSLVSARDDWWTLDFANAFVSPGVNSRGELVPSHGAVGSGIIIYNVNVLFSINIFEKKKKSYVYPWLEK
jgi:hypothetical protein